MHHLLLQTHQNKRCSLTFANTVAAHKENDLSFCSPQLLTQRGIKNSKAAIYKNLHSCLSALFSGSMVQTGSDNVLKLCKNWEVMEFQLAVMR
jgi:hypothetical protein